MEQLRPASCSTDYVGDYPACPNCGKNGLHGWVHRQKHKLADRKAARATRKAEKAEAKERRSATDRIPKDFDDETREAASKSPTLQKQMVELEKKKWLIEKGAPAGSQANPDGKGSGVTTIDPNINGAEATGVIAHEVGHATHGRALRATELHPSWWTG